MLSLFKKEPSEDIGLPGGRIMLNFPIWFSRHGQTDWNKQGRFQGHSDIPLNDKGRQQAFENGKRLKKRLKSLDHLSFYVSPLGRARETLEILREQLDLPRQRYFVDDRLIEVDLGDWNGKTVKEINADDEGVWERREADKWAFKVPGGESYADAAERTREFLMSLEGPSVIVGHGASGRILRGYLNGWEREALTHKTTSQDVIFELKDGKEQQI